MTRQCLWVAVVAVLAMSLGCAVPPEPAATPLPRAGFVQRTLDNGLVVLCHENHAAPVAVVTATVRTGSIFEDEYAGSGISHLCEHLVSGGSTATRTEDDTRKLLESLGGSSNASTSHDRTTYYIRTTADRFDTAVQLVADWMQNATLPDAEFQRERQVIVREIEKDENEPDRVLWALSARTAFSFHPARNPVIGYKDRLLKLTRDDVVAYYRRAYAPDHMVVVAVGDFDAAKTVDRIAALFDAAKPSGRVLRLPPEDPPQQGLREAAAERDVQAAYALVCFRTVPLSHPDLYPLDVLSYILTNGESARLVRRLREEEQLVESVSSWSGTPWYGAGALEIMMTLKPENLDKARAALLDEIEKLKRESVTAAELARATKQKVADTVFANQTVEMQAAVLASNYLETGNPFFDDLYLRGIRAVKAPEVREAARKYLTADNMTVAVVRPKAAARTGPTAPPVAASKTEKLVLPNGLRVLLKRNPAVPVVSVQAYFLGGVLHEDDHTAGTAHLLGEMLTRGTRTRSALELARAFDNMAGSITGGSGNNTVFLKAEVLAEDADRALELLADCLTAPAFPDDELAKAKALTLAALARQTDDWYLEAYNLLRTTLYKASPYRLNHLGTPESVAALTRADLAACHRRLVNARDGVVAVFGDIDVERMKRRAAELFAPLPAAQGDRLADVPRDKPLEKDVAATKQGGKPGTAAVFAAYPTCEMADVKDRDALLVLDAVLSGIDLPGGWLHTELRGKGKGLVYFVDAHSFVGYRTPGYFGVSALTRPDKVDEVIGVIDKSIERAKAARVPADELERAKRMAVTAEVLDRQTNDALAAAAALDELYGFGYDFSERFSERIAQVTADEVLRVAQKYLTRRALVVIRSAAKE